MLGSVKEFARALLELLGTRLKLAANELEEQALRFAEIAIWAIVAVFFFGAALVFLAIVLVLLFWDSHPVAIAAIIASVFLAAGATGAWMVRKLLLERPPLLAATVAELEKDRARVAGGPDA
jgi:uncharacterized membrane protein YqjE